MNTTTPLAMEEKKQIILDAKRIVMKLFGMTESQAYRKIQRTAIELRMTMIAVSIIIIQQFDLDG